MSEPDLLHPLISELRALPRRERTAVLRALTPAERDRVTALIELQRRPQRPVEERAESRRRRFSSWIEARIADSEESARFAMTPAARTLLAKTASELVAPFGAVDAPHPDAGGRTLLAAIGGLFLGKESRP